MKKYNDKDLFDYFKSQVPKEGCGVIAIHKGKSMWIPMTNVSDDTDTFVFDIDEWTKISRVYDIKAIVHSHLNNDNKASDTDIEYCNLTQIPYWIYSYPDMKLNIITPSSSRKPLYGRDYEFGKNDCFELARDIYFTIGINIERSEDWKDMWWEEGKDYFSEENIAKYKFFPVNDNFKKYDLLIFDIFNLGIGHHCGVYLGNDLFAHHLTNRLSCREPLNRWRKKLKRVYRYEA